MDLRCLVFTTDDAAGPPICQALAELGGEADHCSDAAAAIGRAASEVFQIVIADWDEQPNAEYLLKAARARKPAERPLTLAIVSDDASVPKALQSGANSVLRKPLLLNQVKDTLETARALLKAKQDSAAGASASAVARNPSPTSVAGLPGNEAHLRAGDFLTSARPTPSAQFDTEAELQKEMERTTAAVDPLKELEPMAAAVTAEPPEAKAAPMPPPAAPQSDERRGLQWYLNQRATSLPSTPSVPMPAPPPPQRPELMGYDQMAAEPAPAPASFEPPPPPPPPPPVPAMVQQREQKAEAELFSYITQGSEATGDSERTSGSHFRLGKRAILFAVVLATGAMVAAPQAPWHSAARREWARGQRALHAWLNPQPVEPAQAPETHENFAQAGDEYKLPVAENIPDATTDPSQIRVTPVIDPTAKKTDNAGADQNSDGTSANPGDATQPAAPTGTVPANAAQPAAASGTGSAPANSAATGSPTATPPSAQPVANSPAGTAAPAVKPPSVVPAAPTQSVSAQAPQPAAANPPAVRQQSQKPSAGVLVATATPIPPSLRTQMAPPALEAAINKAPDSGLPSIEPVAVSEAAERALVAAQTAIAYPDNAKGQQGTVVLQLLIGRDGTVQDAKFLQGSLAFARAAIDGVKAWKFKPYLMNGRPVSVQTQLTLSFRPGQ